MTWYTVVTFGAQGIDHRPCEAKTEAERKLLHAVKYGRAQLEHCRVYGYASYREADVGSIADDIGKRGRVE